MFSYSRILKYIFAFILIIFAGFRYGVGYDYPEYLGIYEQVPNLSDLILGQGKKLSEIYGESGFLLVNSIVKTFHAPFFILTLVISSISITILFYSVEKLSPYFYITILIYLPRYFGQDMGQIRAGIVQGCMFLAIYYLSQKQTGKYVLTIVVASFFHSVAFIGFAYIVVLKIFKNYRYLLVAYLLSFFLLKVNWIYIIGDNLDFRFVRYITSDNYGGEIGLTRGMIRGLLVTLFFIYNGSNLKDKEAYIYMVLVYIYVFSNFTEIVFHEVATYANRISNVIRIVEYVLLPIQIKLIENKYLKYIYFILLNIYGFYLAYRFLSARSEFFFPYKIAF